MSDKDKYKVKISNQARLDTKDIVLYIKNVLKEPRSAKKYARFNKEGNRQFRVFSTEVCNYR